MNHDAELKVHFGELDEQGYTILSDLLTPVQVEEAVAALKEIYEREKRVVQIHEPGTARSVNMTARGEIFRQLIQLPKLVACMEYLLGPDYILSDMGARSALPGLGPQPLHRDAGKFLPDPPFNVHDLVPLHAQSLFALVDFTPDNGATRFVPRSHNTPVEIADVLPEDEFLFTARAGTVLVYDSRMIHGGGPNSTDKIRYSMTGFCCRSSIKPLCDHTRSIPPEIVREASPLLRRLWGFESQSAYEDRPRHFSIVDAPGAKSIFPYNLGMPDDL